MRGLHYRLDLYWALSPKGLNNFKIAPLRKIIKTFRIPYFIFRNPWILKSDITILPYVEMPVTTRCTLNCDKCCNLMQYYSRGWDLSLEDAISYADTIINTADHIFDFGIIGGETFLYKELTELISHICKSPKVDKVSLTTNGTVLLKDEALIKALSNPKVYVKISDYGAYSKKLNELSRLFDEKGISYKVLEMGLNWRDFGDMSFRGRSEEALREQYAVCSAGCRSYVKGRLHACPRSSHGMDLGLVPDTPRDYADLTDSSLSRKQLRKEINRLLHTDYVNACNYCDKGTALHVRVPAAVQRPRDGVSLNY